MCTLASKRDISTNLEGVVMKISEAIPQTPILESLHSRVYSSYRQLAPPLSEGARAQIMTRGPLALLTALAGHDYSGSDQLWML